MSENGVNQALRRLGYEHGEMTAHGFRAMAATLLNEMGQWNPDAIERQLAHQEASSVRRAYLLARGGEFIDESRCQRVRCRGLLALASRSGTLDHR